MVAALLTPDAQREGGELLQALDAMGVEVTGAAWLHALDVPESTAWRLFVFTPRVDTAGTQEITDYLFARSGWPDQIGAISPFDVLAVSPAEHAYYELVDLAARLPMEQIADLRAEWRGLHVDSVFLYRLGVPQTGPRRERRRPASDRMVQRASWSSAGP